MKPTGLRERKKLKTRNAIQREAMRLFLAQGYDATTIEQIAEAVEISPSTFFNYFPTKEDVVFTDDEDDEFEAALLSRPADEPLGVALRHSLTTLISRIMERDPELLMARARLIMDVPSLRAHIWEDLERTQDRLRVMMAERTGRDPEDYELAVIAGMVVGGLYAANTAWLKSGGGDDLSALLNTAFDIVEKGAQLDALGEAPVTRDRSAPAPADGG